MARITIGGALAIEYQLDGRADAPVLVLSNSLGATMAMWDAQVEALAPYLRLLRYDTRGHGGSSAPAGDYTIEQLGRDVLALTEALHIDRFAFCGLSMGGVIGQWLGVYAAERLTHLVLCNTGAKIGSADSWNTRIDTVRRDGLAPLADATMARWFTPAAAAADPLKVASTHAEFLRCDVAGYLSCCAAVRDADFRGHLARISRPVQVIAGLHDPVTTVDDAQAIVNAVPGARLQVLDTAHLSNLGDVAAFNRTLKTFLLPPA